MGAICSRGDLSIPPRFDGCTDTKVRKFQLGYALYEFFLTKVSNFTMAKEMTAYIRSGPTNQVRLVLLIITSGHFSHSGCCTF